MASSVLEATRAAHEDLERLDRLVVRELQRDPANARDRLFQSHRVHHMLDLVISTSDKLVEIYEDKDGARKDEISTHLTAPVQSDIFPKYYERLKEIRDYHRRNHSARFISETDDYEELLKEEPAIEFTGEEAFGRYLDLHELYNEFINSKFGSLMEYSAYVGTFAQTEKISHSLKATRQYKEYLEHILEYLTSFMYRTEPLQDIDKIFTKLQSEFEEQWANGEVPGWENKGTGKKSESQESAVDLDYYNTVEELVELGPEKLKEALTARALKGGGTVQQRAKRLFLLKHTPLEQLDRKHFAKGDDLKKEIALVEVKMKRLCEILDEVIVRTKENAEKKLTLTYEEMEAEREEEEVQADSESDEEDQQIYNPLKLPMGWDGKPIPYWLYKLHVLGQEFKCEICGNICGNHSYWGRRDYERHFKEWRHQHGMRCLGIPNTKNFNEITSIEEAKALWERIQAKQGLNKWRPDLEEEYEDKDGNIYNKKMYTDLQRQGLI
ncbi:splicing factor SF3a60 homolog isoform X3 [Aegilops tauschii subsp. strangulata]|uniref:splicing factor SF3a60 homolog isoform X3 n=1 Tax=Aegilops tauschii subsp. strangulata TaxID=200361 RepID=UPI00098ABCC9|nr:splicing factor SF3a60 homolog isoform X3 [Aegilops tauschii subsp. strangulata]